MLPTKVDDAQWFCRPNLQVKIEKCASVQKKQPTAHKTAFDSYMHTYVNTTIDKTEQNGTEQNIIIKKKTWKQQPSLLVPRKNDHSQSVHTS